MAQYHQQQHNHQHNQQHHQQQHQQQQQQQQEHQPDKVCALQFPWKLHVLLGQTAQKGQSGLIRWMPEGQSFKVYDKKEFASTVMPDYFNSSTYKSFQRNLNLWGFETVCRGFESGVLSHPYFVRGQPDLCHRMVRVSVKKGKLTATATSNATTVTAVPTEVDRPTEQTTPSTTSSAAAAAAAATLMQHLQHPTLLQNLKQLLLAQSTSASAHAHARTRTRSNTSLGVPQDHLLQQHQQHHTHTASSTSQQQQQQQQQLLQVAAIESMEQSNRFLEQQLLQAQEKQRQQLLLQQQHHHHHSQTNRQTNNNARLPRDNISFHIREHTIQRNELVGSSSENTPTNNTTTTTTTTTAPVLLDVDTIKQKRREVALKGSKIIPCRARGMPLDHNSRVSKNKQTR
jgi:hypothetical protein